MSLAKAFWEKPLQSLNPAEWDALCDGCGKCCLVKLQDEDDESIVYTQVACQYLSEDCHCTVYAQRQLKKPECLLLSQDNIADFAYLPTSCAYRLRYEGKSLPNWHPLLVGNTTQMHQQGHSIKGWFHSEAHIHEDELINFIVEDFE